jgi:hypothetical protein
MLIIAKLLLLTPRALGMTVKSMDKDNTTLGYYIFKGQREKEGVTLYQVQPDRQALIDLYRTALL